MRRVHDATAIPQLGHARIHVLRSKWHQAEVGSLVEHFANVMARAGTADLTIHELSGALEFPLACADIVDVHGKVDAIACFAVLLKGETAHFDMILDTLSATLGGLSVSLRVPIINGIIPAMTPTEVAQRTANDGANKGIEAGLAAIETILWRRRLRERAGATRVPQPH